MISLEDVIAFSEWPRKEVRAIAEHEHTTDIIAAALGHRLLQAKNGQEQITNTLMPETTLSPTGASKRSS